MANTTAPVTPVSQFDDWMERVDYFLKALCGLCHRDLPDVCYRDWFDDGLSPKNAASRAWKSAKSDMGE